MSVRVYEREKSFACMSGQEYEWTRVRVDESEKERKDMSV